MVRHIFLFAFIFFSIASTATEVQFEGYYRLELESKPIGYIIQRYETDAKTKTIRYSYFLKTNALGGDIQESLKAEAKTKDKAEFEPISYQYTGQVGKELKSIDGSFKKGVVNKESTELMQIVRTEGKKVTTSTYKIPEGTFLSSFLSYYMLQLGIKTGKKFTYSAVAEEDGNSYKGEAVVKGEEKFAGQAVFRVENSFVGKKFIAFMTPQGEVLGTEAPASKLLSTLVANPTEATTGFEVPNKTIMLVFGNIPSGKINALSRAKGTQTAKQTQPADSGD